MRIKLAILEQDQSYLSRIVSVFSTKYSDKFEIYSFTNQEVAMASLDNAKIDVLVADEFFDIPVNSLPKRCGLAYFVDSADIDSVKDQKAICKFQKAELIYKQILSVYSEKAGSLAGFRSDDNSTKIVFFNSVSGGTGASCMAAACALHYASQGKKVLYLNLEKFGTSDVFFVGEGQFGFSDIIYALKSKKSNLSIKLESCVKSDYRGVCFYSKTKVALDMLELDADDIIRLLSELKSMGVYDYIIVDTDFSIDKSSLKVLQQSQAIVWVGDGSEISNEKIYRAHSALTILEQNSDLPLTRRLCLVYNKFSSKTSSQIEGIELRNIGGAPRYEHATAGQIIDRLSKLEFFDQIL